MRPYLQIRKAPGFPGAIDLSAERACKRSSLRAQVLDGLAHHQGRGSSKIGILAACSSAGRTRPENQRKKILRSCKTKPSEARMSCRINKHFRKEAKNKANKPPKRP